MHLRLAPIVLTAALLGVAAGADVPGEFAVPSAQIRAPVRVQRHVARVTVEFRGDVGVSSFDPGSERVRLSVAGVDLLDKPADDPATRIVQTLPWSFDCTQKSEGLRVHATLNLARGVFRIRTRGVDLAALAAAGPIDVPVRLELGDSVFERRIDFRARPRAWSHSGRRLPPPPAPVPPPPPTPLFATLWSGIESPVVVASTRVFTAETEFAAFWQQIPGAGPVPAVDFGTDMVVGVFLGVRGDALYSVGVTAADVQGEDLRVRYQELRPGPNCPVSGLLAAWPYPFTLACVPRVAGAVSFTALPVGVRDCP